MVVLGVVLALAGSSDATFHVVSISALGVGLGGDPNAQFVELRLDLGGQTNSTNTRLTAFDATGHATELLLLDHGLANGTLGANVLFATNALLARTTISADFVIPPGIPSPTGMICWGAPGIVPPNPAQWDLDKPNNYVDCVAYGGFTGATRNASGTPTALPPGDGTKSLTREKNTSVSGSNDLDFDLATPNVCNNAGACAGLQGGGNPACGDADGNGSITVTDGVQTLRAAAGLSSPCTLARCDVNDSGDITVTDGVQVLRAAAGLATTLTCPAS
jgi:hypothetical protein